MVGQSVRNPGEARENLHLKVKKNCFLQICTLTSEISYFFIVSDLKNIISYKKKQKICGGERPEIFPPDPA